MAPAIYRQIEGSSRLYYAVLAGFAVVIVAGLAAAWTMEHFGHRITGMNNQIVWGMPHVFAVFLIVAASGALNVASLGSVFGRGLYKPLAPLSALLAIALLVGGLAVLVLDLGRPDRLIVAATNYNFRSIFAWNIFLYIGFLAVVAVYLWLLIERRLNRYSAAVGLVAMLWRLALTTGTGLIFGFLVAREAYDAALLAPLFIAMSLSLGTAVFILVLLAAYGATGRPLGDKVVRRLARLMGVFVGLVLYFVVVQHLTGLYAAEHRAVERFILVDGGAVTWLFWAGQVVLGGLVPLALVFHPRAGAARAPVALAAALVVVGGMAQVYVIIIGGQAYPLVLFPGMEVSSSFADGVVNTYAPSLFEIGLGLGGVAFAGAMVTLAVKLLRLLPEDLSDAVTDPHHRPRAEESASGGQAAEA